MIQTKKRSLSSDGEKSAAKKPDTKKLKSNKSAETSEKPIKKSVPKDTDSKGKFQKKLSPGGKKFDGAKGGASFKDRNNKNPLGEKKAFVANTPESKREYWNSLKSKQKELREQRRKLKTKDLYELSVGAKKIYETLKK